MTSYRLGAEGDRPLSTVPQDSPPIVRALRYGITAPSAHNTQPWRILLMSDTEAHLYFDPARRLPATDPPGRQVHISHGTMIELTSIAATSIGYRTDVTLLPDGEMTISEFGTKPTAIIRLIEDPEVRPDPLFMRVLARRSSRLSHDGPPLTQQEQDEVALPASIAGVSAGWVRPDNLPVVLDIARKAMEIEVNDRELFEETNVWFRFSDQEIATKGDGLNLETSGMSGMSLALARRFTRPGTWHRNFNRRPYLAGFARSIETTRSMLTLTTATNTMFDWITTGRSYLRAQLTADQLGLRFQPTSQVLQEYPQMDKLRVELEDLLGVEPPAKIQMLIRVGRTRPPALSPRRELSAMVENWADLSRFGPG